MSQEKEKHLTDPDNQKTLVAVYSLPLHIRYLPFGMTWKKLSILKVNPTRKNIMTGVGSRMIIFNLKMILDQLGFSTTIKYETSRSIIKYEGMTLFVLCVLIIVVPT